MCQRFGNLFSMMIFHLQIPFIWYAKSLSLFTEHVRAETQPSMRALVLVVLNVVVVKLLGADNIS